MDGKPKAKQPARRNPVARREQNRLASRNYRASSVIPLSIFVTHIVPTGEKRKQKLALLGQLLDTESPESQQPSSSAAQDDDVAAGPAVVGVAPGAFLAAGNDTAEGEVVAPGDRSTTGWTWQSASNNVAAILGPEALAAWKLCNSNEQLHNKPDSRPDASRDGHAGPGMPPGESSLSSNQDDLIISVLSSVKSLSQKQKRDLIRHLGHLVNESPDTTTSSSSTTNNHDAQLPPKSWVSTASRGAAAPAAGTRLQVEARRFADFIDRCSRAVAGGHNPVSLVRNYSLQTGYFGAIFANCFALGMSNVEPMMEEEGVSLFSLGPETGYHQSQLGAVRPKFHSITPDLRPSDLQLVRGHHPYLVSLCG